LLRGCGRDHKGRNHGDRNEDGTQQGARAALGFFRHSETSGRM
jgi:hypothetical protein